MQESETVLVTGATGFIGGALARKLTDLGRPLRVLVRDRSRLPEAIGGSADIVEGDITDEDAAARATEGVATVFHIAGTFREPGLPDRRYVEVNVEGTLNLLTAATRNRVRRFVHCSTSGIHGSITGPPADEEHPLVLEEIYERTKAEGEQAALRFGSENGIEVTVLRPAQVYGPGDTRLLKLFRMAGSRVTIWFGPGTAHYHLLYIDDLVDAFLLAAEAEGAPGEAFLIAGSELPTLNELIVAVARSMGREDPRLLRLPAEPFMLLGLVCEKVCIPLGISPPIYRRRVEFFTKNKAYDIGKARRMLGFQPRIDMEEGLRRTVEWYRRTGHL